MQVYICPWCDRVFRSETERIGHLLTGHGVEVREEEEGEGEEGGATPHPFILPRSHTEEEQDQLGESVTWGNTGRVINIKVILKIVRKGFWQFFFHKKGQ